MCRRWFLKISGKRFKLVNRGRKSLKTVVKTATITGFEPMPPQYLKTAKWLAICRFVASNTEKQAATHAYKEINAGRMQIKNGVIVGVRSASICWRN
ncbi:hypothetical protein THIOSC15_2070004 [uncultured Thiomicrorhabdus sp.]